ncbi:Transcriptional regulatory protein WalR [Nymphon striatum]|nr:Transcriptional regulatory protein WalR [Nymphon striatum]
MAQLKNILLVDDDDDLREALSEQLVMTEDFEVFEADSGVTAMERVKEQLYDLIVLDVGLEDTDGRELCRLMRKQGVKSPILMLTGHDSDADTILGLDAGANDYVTKPFKFPVLLARIRAQLRQHEQSEDAVFTLGPYTFKPSMKMLITEDERKIRLTEKETNILKYLYRSTEGVVPRDILLHEVWGYNAGVTTHTLETHIYRLRQKIEPEPSNARLLVTESGVELIPSHMRASYAPPCWTWPGQCPGLFLCSHVYPSAHATDRVAKHVTMHQPTTGVVEDANDVAFFACVHQCCVAQVTQAAIVAKFIEVMAMQVDAMWKGRIVHQGDLYRFPARKRSKGGILYIRDIVEGPNVVATMLATHRATHHCQCQVLAGVRRGRQVRRGQRGNSAWLSVCVFATYRKIGQPVGKDRFEVRTVVTARIVNTSSHSAHIDRARLCAAMGSPDRSLGMKRSLYRSDKHIPHEHACNEQKQGRLSVQLFQTGDQGQRLLNGVAVADARRRSGVRTPIHTATAIKCSVSAMDKGTLPRTGMCPTWANEQTARMPPNADTQSPMRPIGKPMISKTRPAIRKDSAVPTGVDHNKPSISGSVMPPASPVRFAARNRKTRTAATSPKPANAAAKRRK